MKLTRILDGRWLIEHDGTLIAVRDEELDEIALAASFRLKVAGIIPTGSGVGLELTSVTGADPDPDSIKHLHLCYSDDAAETADAVLRCAKVDHGTGQMQDPEPMTIIIPAVQKEPDTGRHHLRDAQ